MTEREDYQRQELYSQEERVEQARRSMVSFAESIQALAEANRSLLEDREQSFGCSVWSSITRITADWHVLECTAQFSDAERTRLHFRGESLPSGFPVLSEGRFFGVANFSVPPSELVGSWMSYSVKMTNDGTPPAHGKIEWFAGRPPGYQLVGTYLGDGTPRPNPPLNGTGIWTDITDRS
jgi:hypothetical protein